MDNKKLNPSRNDYLIFGYILCVAILFYAIACLYGGTFHRDYYFLIAFVVLDILFFAYAFRQRSYYMFMPDGIYIFRRPDNLLAKIIWNDVYSCTVMEPNRNSNYPYYLVLIMKGTALINNQLAITCSGAISDHAAKKYMLHRTAEQLARSKITVERFLQQDVFLVSVTKNQLERARKMWAKSR